MSDELMFRSFEEFNDQEGETWIFWLQVNGNENELVKLSRALHSFSYSNYKLTDIVIPEGHVDILTEFGGGGYMRFHHKVTGKLTSPSIDLEDFSPDDVFYKGGIRDLFVQPT